ncbi:MULTISPECIES: flavin reductase family protein [Streptomyces]|uniref:flavin reductase family protein n=1 Tax=Streptomyces TaxID=1883 RepID=UPI0003627DF3|nr:MULTISPECIES: flavin reductase family protein [Streptomyces]MBE8477394.1 flavin reductase family protein [Streptomyces justiciae]
MNAHSPRSDDLSGHGVAVAEPSPVLTADAFKLAFRLYPGGVSLITADAGTGPVALTATSVSPVSAEPPLIMFSLSALSSSTPTIRDADTVVIHLLNAGTLDLAQLGATSGIDRFADTTRWARLATGEAVFTEAPVWIRARVHSRMEAGGSTVIVAEALESSVRSESFDALASSDGLVYVNRAWHRIGSHSQID